MISTVEKQTNERIATEQPINKVEGVQPARTVEVEKTTDTVPQKQETVSQDPTPQTISAIKENSVEDKGGIGAVIKGEWGSELDIKSGGNYSVDITTISKN